MRLLANVEEAVLAVAGAQQVAARIGGLGVYATPVDLRALQRTRGERAALTGMTLVGSWLVAPFALLIPPHFESGVVAFLLGLYFARRAWVGEWRVDRMAGSCPRCDAVMTLKSGTMLYLPHTLHCGSCRTELWLELEPAPDVPLELRLEARERLAADRRQELSARPPKTWSPASSDWGK
jgi:hypothetical protein